MSEQHEKEVAKIFDKAPDSLMKALDNMATGHVGYSPDYQSEKLPDLGTHQFDTTDYKILPPHPRQEKINHLEQENTRLTTEVASLRKGEKKKDKRIVRDFKTINGLKEQLAASKRRHQKCTVMVQRDDVYIDGLKKENAQLAAHNRVLVEVINETKKYLQKSFSDLINTHFYDEKGNPVYVQGRPHGLYVMEEAAKKLVIEEPSSLRAKRELAVLEAVRNPWLLGHDNLAKFERVFEERQEKHRYYESVVPAIKSVFAEAVEALEGEDE